MRLSSRPTILCLAAPLAVLLSFGAMAQVLNLEPPPEGEFVLDYAGLIPPEDEVEINELAAASLRDKVIPIITVTIPSMAQYGGAGMRIETFATLLYNQWGIGYEKLGDEYWNKGILLLVAHEDRFARIELGDGWGREDDATAQGIMDDQIVARFKRGDFSGGILNGVQALNAMARGETLPRAPISWRNVALVVAFIGLVIFTVVSLIRKRSSGWAWLFWAFAFGVLGFLLISMMRSGARGGGFSGGGFGGGFSGGGGATGSW